MSKKNSKNENGRRVIRDKKTNRKLPPMESSKPMPATQPPKSEGETK